MASNVFDSNHDIVEVDKAATPTTQPDDMPTKPTIPEEEFGSGLCDSTYQPQAWKDMRKLFQQETLSDIMLMAEGQSIACHKFLLAAASEYFYNRLVVEPESVEHNLLELKDISFPALKVIISYIYTGHINITVENARDVFPALKVLKLKSACKLSEEFLQDAINPGNCVSLYRMATEQKAKVLKANAEEVMINNFQEVVCSAEFLDMSIEELERYIQNDNIDIPNEDVVFGAVVSWFAHKSEELRKFDFSRVIKHVRLRYCTSHYLTHVVAHEPLMDNLACQKLIVAAVTSKSSDGNFHQTCQGHAEADTENQGALPRKSYRSASTLLAMGGFISPGRKASRECWCLVNNGWNVLEESRMPQQTSLFSACVSPYGILVTGGSAGGETINECWILSTSSLQWTAVAKLNTARHRHASVSVGGQPYVVGGMDGDGNPLSSVECLSDVSSKWDKMPNLPKAMYHGIAVACRGQLLVFGGKNRDGPFLSSYVFRKERGEWQTLPSMPMLCSFGSGAAFKSKVYILGGFENSCLCYDPIVSQWTTLSQCRHEHSDGSALVWKGKILVCGGRSGEAKHDKGTEVGGTSVIEEYDPETDTWTISQIELPQRLSSHFVSAIEFNQSNMSKV